MHLHFLLLPISPLPSWCFPNNFLPPLVEITQARLKVFCAEVEKMEEEIHAMKRQLEEMETVKRRKKEVEVRA